MDGCGIFYPYSNTRCDNATGMTAAVLVCGAADCRGSAPGPGSACFASNVTVAGYQGDRDSARPDSELRALPAHRASRGSPPLPRCKPSRACMHAQSRATTRAATPTAVPAALPALRWAWRFATWRACGGRARLPASSCRSRGSMRARSVARPPPTSCASAPARTAPASPDSTLLPAQLCRRAAALHAPIPPPAPVSRSRPSLRTLLRSHCSRQPRRLPRLRQARCGAASYLAREIGWSVLG
jgi:hypothetical protein